MKFYLVFLFSLFLLASCEKNSGTNDVVQNTTKPITPTSFFIDINFDNISDFVLDYEELSTDDIPSSGGGIIGFIKPLNDNQILLRNFEGSLFLAPQDTIRKNNNSNSYWYDYNANIININRRDYSVWDKNWSVISKLSNNYYLAFKLKNNNSEEIGYLHLNIDSKNGNVSILDKKITSSDELIIE